MVYFRTSIAFFKYWNTVRNYYIRNNSIEITLNHIILIAKYHTYWSATSNAHLVFAAFLERLKNTIETGKYIAYTSHASEEFSKK